MINPLFLLIAPAQSFLCAGVCILWSGIMLKLDNRKLFLKSNYPEPTTSTLWRYIYFLNHLDYPNST